jgi:hypothetical protein
VKSFVETLVADHYLADIPDVVQGMFWLIIRVEEFFDFLLCGENIFKV